eukprot:PhF_6_TR17055/c0_g1_i1/m.26020
MYGNGVFLLLVAPRTQSPPTLKNHYYPSTPMMKTISMRMMNQHGTFSFTIHWSGITVSFTLATPTLLESTTKPQNKYLMRTLSYMHCTNYGINDGFKQLQL